MNKNSRRKVKVIMAIATVLLSCSFAFIVVCGLLKDHGYGDFWWPAVGLIGFFTCDLSAIALFIYVSPDAIEFEYKDKSKKYDLQKFCELENVPQLLVEQAFIRHGFKRLDNGYLRKKKFTFLKDSITYYVGSRSTLDFIQTVQSEFINLDKVEKKSKNNCAILFIYKNNVDDNDLKYLRHISERFILNETILPTSNVQTCIIVLVDKNANKGYFLDLDKKYSIAVYKYGCRLLKKYFICG